jgi:hypothetical protein
VLVLVDLVLSFAIIRRLRETETTLIEMTTPPASGMAPGEPMPEFVSQNGELSSADLAGEPVLLGFFSPSCRHCPAQAEQLAERADEITGKGVRVVSVLTVADGAPDDLSPTLRKAGTLITESDPGVLMAAFGAEATPSLLMFGDDGRLLAKGHAVDEVLASR